jgi:hypothetical protein
LGKVVLVGYQRPRRIGADWVQEPVDGEKMLMSGMPWSLEMCPPVTSTRPSDSRLCPAQNSSA